VYLTASPPLNKGVSKRRASRRHSQLVDTWSRMNDSSGKSEVLLA